MGQYYKPVNESKRQYLLAHAYDNGLKLMEHNYIDNDFVRAVEALIGEGGPWHGDVWTWEGDCADDFEPAPDGDETWNLYHKAGCEFEKIHPDPIAESRRFVANASRRLFIDCSKIPADRWNSRIHPMPLLLSAGNGRGGGDYRGASVDSVGSWHGDVVWTADAAPEGFVEVTFDFHE